MFAPGKQPELSPLDQIRQAEAEITRRIAAARLEAEQYLLETRKSVAASKNQAIMEGRQEGQTRYKEIISEAENQAQIIINQAHKHAKELKHKGTRNMDKAVSQVLQIVLGLEAGER